MEDVVDYDSMFAQSEEQEQKERKRAMQRAETSEEVIASAMFFHYIVKDEKGMNPRESHIPVRVNGTSREGRPYPKFLEMQASVKSLKSVPDLCTPKQAPDGSTYWTLKTTVGIIGEEPKRLLKMWRDEAYAHEECEPSGNPQLDARYRLVRKYIEPAGDTILPVVDIDVHEGEMHTFKHPFDTKSVLFAKVPGRPHIYLVQPATPLIMRRLEPKIWLTAREITKEVPATADTPAVTLKEWVVSASFKLDCKLIEVAESNDASLSSSERLHAAHSHDRDAHQLVRMADYIPAAARAYWYVAEYRSLANPQVANTKGITITLDRYQQREQFVRERQVAGEAGGAATVEYTADFRKIFNVFQWTGMPNPKCKFKVTIAQEQDKFNKKKQVGGSTDVWQQWGIFDALTYGEIMTTNYRIPFHVYAKSWPRKITEHPPNKLLKDGVVDPEFPDTQGYYYLGIEILVPDYLRYFRGPYGVMVSVDFIKREFAPWKSIKSGNRVAYELKMRDATVPNAVNDLGLQSAVVSIGNGQTMKVNPETDEEREDAKFHAVQGDISSLLTGGHDFYVLCSKPMTPDEQNRYCAPTGNANRTFADDFITTARREAAAVGKHAYYWLFAVNKAARTVQLQRPPVVVPPKYEQEDSGESSSKRLRTSEDQDDEDNDE